MRKKYSFTVQECPRESIGQIIRENKFDKNQLMFPGAKITISCMIEAIVVVLSLTENRHDDPSPIAANHAAWHRGEHGPAVDGIAPRLGRRAKE